MNAKNKIWQYLNAKGQATNAELAEMLRGQPGQLSVGQRLREIRQELQTRGGDLTCVEKKPGIYLYKLVLPEPPRTEHEEIVAANNLAQEGKINRQAYEENNQLAFL